VLLDSNKPREGIHVSTLLGCPRATAIKQNAPLAVDPLRMNAVTTGQAWHAYMYKASIDQPSTEFEVAGYIAGVPVCGRVDRLRDDVIEDWKHGSDFSIKYTKEGAKPAHQAQLSIYAELISQEPMAVRPTRGRIWHHSSVDGKDAMKAIEFDLWPIEQVLAFRPHDGAFTVLELLKQAASKGPWTELLLAGESMRFGTKSMCDYCSKFTVCKTAATGAPF
jgi:hypothetical protein